MSFIEIQRELVNVLLTIPAMDTFSGRTSLLNGLPDASLMRDQNIGRLDLNNVISGIERLGRLASKGGMRPVIVIVDNALGYVPKGSEAADRLQEIRRQLEDYYGGDIQPKMAHMVPDQTLEALIFGQQRDTRLPFAFIEQAHLTARSIARLTVPRFLSGQPDGQAVYGTGWIIAPGVLLTNHHVIEARRSDEPPAQPIDFEAQAQHVVARFDYYAERAGGTPLECKNATLIAAQRKLDFAVIELTEADKIADREPLRFVPAQTTFARGARINIVQHPKGGPLRFAIRNNFYVSSGTRPQFLWYQTDTEPGASGSPVCNDDWKVLALHHASTPVPRQTVPQEVIDGKPVSVVVLNEAVKVHDILDSLPSVVRQRIDAAQIAKKVP